MIMEGIQTLLHFWEAFWPVYLPFAAIFIIGKLNDGLTGDKE